MKFQFLSKESILFVCLGGVFVSNALLAEFIGVKIFSVEKSLGLVASKVPFGPFDMTAGVLLWPFVFVLTDVINEYYGKRGVFFLSVFTAILISYSFLVVKLSISAAPATWWPKVNTDKNINDMQMAYQAIFGQSNWIILGSLIAFLIGQILDISVFKMIKRRTGEKLVWLRATGSTLFSQMVDSFVVLFVAFYLGAGWPFSLVLSIATTNYVYKVVLAIVLTPLIYLTHALIDWYLGIELSQKLKSKALKS